MTLSEPLPARTGDLPNAKLSLTGVRMRASVPARALPFVLALSGILWLSPYWVWTAPAYFRLSVALVTVAFLAMFGAARASLSTRNILLALGLLALFLYFASHRGSGGIFAISSGWLAVIVFVLADDWIKRDAYHYFAVAFAITLVPAIIVVALAALGVDVPWHTLANKRFDFDVLLGNEPGYYRQYLGSVVRNNQILPLGRGEVIRLHGMYIEPGVVGTFAALLLVADEMTLRKRPHNVILLVGGALSFSMAFYAIMFFYLLLRRPLTMLALSGVVVKLVLSLTTLRENPFLQLFFLNRLTVSDGWLVGDNRVSSTFEQMYDEFWKADVAIRLFGSPHDIGDLVNTGTFSYKVVVYAYGVVGLVALIVFLVAATTSSSRGRAAITLLLLFILSIYQRPDVLALPFLLVLLGGAAHLRQADDLSPSSSQVAHPNAGMAS